MARPEPSPVLRALRIASIVETATYLVLLAGIAYHLAGGPRLTAITGSVHGVVFLGRGATSGEAEVVGWFGDGPPIEPTLIEPLGPRPYSLGVEIELQKVPLGCELPPPGSILDRLEHGMRADRVRINGSPARK